MNSSAARRVPGLIAPQHLEPDMNRHQTFVAILISTAALTAHPEIRFALAVVDVEAIDRLNIRQAAWRGMQQALDQLDLAGAEGAGPRPRQGQNPDDLTLAQQRDRNDRPPAAGGSGAAG